MLVQVFISMLLTLRISAKDCNLFGATFPCITFIEIKCIEFGPKMWDLVLKSGFPATLEIRGNLENEFPFFPVRGNSGNQGKLRDPERKDFRQFDMTLAVAEV